MLYALSVLFGGLVGFALGMTGGGGSLLAVPLLVYGLSVAPREAFGISLAAVGATALVGVVPRIIARQAEVGTGLIFAAAGMVGAPAGTWLAGMIAEPVLLMLFAGLMLLIARSMWKSSTANSSHEPDATTNKRPATCERTETGSLKLNSRCAVLLILLGLATGVMSGMFGVGGGFVIVPALVMFAGMTIHRAIATSLLVIVLVSVSGVASHFVAGRGISPSITGMFIAGGVLGMSAGGRVARRLPAAALQRVFATGIVAIAIFMVGKTLS